MGSTAFSATNLQRRSPSTCTEGGERWGKGWDGEGEGKGQERGLYGRGRGRDVPDWQVGPNEVWEENVRGHERGSMTGLTTMVSRAMVESSGG